MGDDLDLTIINACSWNWKKFARRIKSQIAGAIVWIFFGGGQP